MADDYDPTADAWASYGAAQDALRARHEAIMAAGAKRIKYFGEGGCDAVLIEGDCLEILPTLGRVDAVVTDPPYPDCYVKEYQYSEERIAALDLLPCWQMVFWSGRAPFPLAHTAVHIWNKNPSNHGAQYERIFERNGGAHQKVFTHYMVNSTVAAMMVGDELNEHPSQKPIRLLKRICEQTKGATILDPFMGSGTTGVAALQLGRKFIGVEIDETYFSIACKRIEEAWRQPRLFEEPKAKAPPAPSFFDLPEHET